MPTFADTDTELSSDKDDDTEEARALYKDRAFALAKTLRVERADTAAQAKEDAAIRGAVESARRRPRPATRCARSRASYNVLHNA